MTHTFETHYADLRRRAVLQLEARRKECDALDPAFAALRAKRSRVFSMPAQGAKLTLSTLRLEEEALLKRYGLPKDYLMFIDESHVTVPQVGAMYKGDRSRKDMLVDYGFRLPSARDNRPLKFDEFEPRMGQTIFVSATPADYEKEHSEQTVEQVIRPTGLLEPQIYIRPVKALWATLSPPAPSSEASILCGSPLIG